jgi:hypothetical protein
MRPTTKNGANGSKASRTSSPRQRSIRATVPDARYAYRARVMGFSAPVETEIHDFVRNRGWTGVSTKGIAARTYWTFEPIGDATKFTYAMEYQMPIPLLGPLLDSWFARPQWQKIVERSLNNLKRHFASPVGTPSHQAHLSE